MVYPSPTRTVVFVFRSQASPTATGRLLQKRNKQIYLQLTQQVTWDQVI